MDDRAVSEVLGFALIFALVVSTVILVALIGFGALEETRDTEELNNAERAFDVMADNMADIYQEGAPSRATEISLQSAQLEAGSGVRINVTGINQTGSVFVNNFNIDPIIFRSGDSEVVYSAGAIFRTQREGGIRIADPPLMNNSKHLLLQVAQIRNRGDIDSVSGRTVRVRAENGHRRSVPGFTSSPTDLQTVIINVTSPRSELWASYFRDRLSMDCVEPKANNVRCTIEDPKSVFLSRTVITYKFE
jgi:hypothetical protein